MKRLWIALALFLLATPALGQGNPTCPTRPVGDNSNACASTAFVQTAVAANASGMKLPVKAATTANITLSGAQTIDGVSVVAGDFVLAKNQSTGAENGIYTASAGAWTRRSDSDATGDLVQGDVVIVVSGTVSSGIAYELTSATPTIGTTSQTWASWPARILGELTISAANNSNGLSIQNRSLTGTKKWIWFPFESTSTPNDTCLYLFENNTASSATRATFCTPGFRFGDNLQATSTLESAGSFSTPFVVKTANYIATALDTAIACDATAGGVTITIPVSTSFIGREITVVKVDATQNYCAVTPASGTIDGLTEYLITKKTSVTAKARTAGWTMIGFVYPAPYKVDGWLPDWAGGATIRFNGGQASVDQPTAGKPIYEVTLPTSWQDMNLLATNSVGEIWGLDTCAAKTISGGTGQIDRPLICTVSGGGAVTWSPSATFTATGAGTNLTTSAVVGTISIGASIYGTGVPTTSQVRIVSQTSGVTGGAGVYVTSVATTSVAASLSSYVNTGLYFYWVFCDSGSRKGQQGVIASQSWLFSGVTWPTGCSTYYRLIDFSVAWNDAMTATYSGGIAQFSNQGWPGNAIRTAVDWSDSTIYTALAAGTDTSYTQLDISRWCTIQQDRVIYLEGLVTNGSAFVGLSGGSGDQPIGKAVTGLAGETAQVPFNIIYGANGFIRYKVSSGASLKLLWKGCGSLQQ